MRAIIDKLRRDHAVCFISGFKGINVFVPLKSLPKPIADGDTIVYYGREWYFDEIEHKSRKLLSKKLVDDVFK